MKLVLGCTPFEERHTGEELAKFIDTVCEAWNIRNKVGTRTGLILEQQTFMSLLVSHAICASLCYIPLQVKGVVSDTASNMRAMMNFLVDMGWSGCLNHIIQLVIRLR